MLGLQVNTLIKSAKIFLAALALLLLLLLVVLAIGFRVDLSPWRSFIVQTINGSMPYQVSLEGDLEARVSLRPSLHVTDVRLSPSDKPEQNIVTVGQVSAKVGVLPLLRHTIDIDHIQATDVAIRLERNEQGWANWEVETEDSSETEDHSSVSSRSDASMPDYQLNIDQQIAVKNLSFNYQDRQEEIRFDGKLEDLTLSLDEEEYLLMQAQGLLQGADWSVEARTALNQHLRGQRGDIALTLRLGDSNVVLNGVLDPNRQQVSTLDLEARIPSDDMLQLFVDPELTDIAPVSVSSQLTVNAAHVKLNDISVQLADSDLSGHLELLRRQQPEIHGRLIMERLDLNPLLMDQAADNEELVVDSSGEVASTGNSFQNSQDTAAEEDDDERLPFNQLVHNWLNSAVIDLDVQIRETLGFPVTVENTHLQVKMTEGQLQAPLSVSLAGIDLQGEWQTSASKRRIQAHGELSATNANVGPLMTQLLDSSAQGEVAVFSLQFDSRGRTPGRLIRNARVQLLMSDGGLLIDDVEDWRIRQAEIMAGLAQETRLTLDGDLLAIPVNISMHADPLIAIRHGKPWYLDMQVESPVFTASAKGFVSESGIREDSQFTISMKSPELGKLSNWLGVRPDATESLQFSGEVRNRHDALNIQLSELVIGDSAGRLDIEWLKKEQDQTLTRIIARLPKINVDQLTGLWPEEEVADSDRPQDASQSQGLTLDVPLLKDDIVIGDADIDFRMDHLLVAGQNFKDLKFTGYIRDGRLKPSPLSAVYAGSWFYGDLALDLRQQSIESDFNLMVDRPDFGRMLSEMELMEDADIQLDKARFTLKLRGNTAAELIRTVELEAALEGGVLRLTDQNSGAVSEVMLNSGSISASPNMRMTLKMDGELKQLPVTFEVSTNPLNRLLTSRKNVNMQMSAHINDMSFLSYAVVNLPVNRRDARLGLIFRAPSLANLNPLLNVDMPPYGPITVNGRFGMTPDGYEVRQSKISVGDSHLTGEITLDTRGKPELDIQLTAPSIQLDDFRTGDWKAWSTDSEGIKEEKGTAASVKDEGEKGEKGEKEQALISLETLQQGNMDFRLDVNEVLSGEDQLGAGQLHIQLQDGELFLNPLHLALPGGEIKASGFLKPQEEGFSIGLKADVDHFDYGVLARRIDPETSMQGDVSFRMDILTSAASPDDLFSHAKGGFGFAVWPRDFEAGIIDLWAVGLASAVLPRLGPSDPSQLNCAVGTFKLEDGQMNDNVLMLDTSRMQVLGHSEVDFTHEQISLVLVPRAKTAQIFGLSLPVMVTGSFNDFGFGVPSGELIITTLRFITSPVVAPLRWLLEQPLEGDGSQLCEQMYRESPNPPLK